MTKIQNSLFICIIISSLFMCKSRNSNLTHIKSTIQAKRVTGSAEDENYLLKLSALKSYLTCQADTLSLASCSTILAALGSGLSVVAARKILSNLSIKVYLSKMFRDVDFYHIYKYKYRDKNDLINKHIKKIAELRQHSFDIKQLKVKPYRRQSRDKVARNERIQQIKSEIDVYESRIDKLRKAPHISTISKLQSTAQGKASVFQKAHLVSRKLVRERLKSNLPIDDKFIDKLIIAQNKALGDKKISREALKELIQFNLSEGNYKIVKNKYSLSKFLRLITPKAAIFFTGIVGAGLSAADYVLSSTPVACAEVSSQFINEDKENNCKPKLVVNKKVTNYLDLGPQQQLQVRQQHAKVGQYYNKMFAKFFPKILINSLECTESKKYSKFRVSGIMAGKKFDFNVANRYGDSPTIRQATAQFRDVRYNFQFDKGEKLTYPLINKDSSRYLIDTYHKLKLLLPVGQTCCSNRDQVKRSQCVKSLRNSIRTHI